MARETKVGLIVGLGVILFVSVFVSDYLSVPQQQEALADDHLPDYVQQTTNQPEFVRQPEDTTEPAGVIEDPRELAAVSLRDLENLQGQPALPENDTVVTPPFREAPTLAGPVDDTTPIAYEPANPNNAPVGFTPIDDTRLAHGHQLVPERQGPGSSPLADLSHVDIPEPQLITAQQRTIEHTVAEGETLTAIARKHYDGDGNLWRSIRDANPGKVGSNGEIVKGVVLTIPKRSTEPDDPAAGLVNRATGNGDRPARQRVRMVKVKEGETLSELAAEHLGSATKWQLIMDVNTDVLEKPEHLRAGMKLRIPAQEVVGIVEAANNALTEVTPADVTAVIERQAANTYTVKEGDSLYLIAKQLLGDGDRYDDIYRVNKDTLSSANDIRVGMTLKLPNR